MERLTHLCEVAAKAVGDDPLYEDGDRLMVLMHDDGIEAGAVMVGFESDEQVMALLVAHVEAFAIARDLPVRIVKTGDPSDN